MKGDIITINGTQYKISCESSIERKYPCVDWLGVQVGIFVKRLSDNKVLSWQEIKGTCIAEKITDYIQNAINGQRSFYWDWSKDKEVSE